METNRRQYSEEFKKEAVEYSLASEKSVKEVAKDLGISLNLPLEQRISPISSPLP